LVLFSTKIKILDKNCDNEKTGILRIVKINNMKHKNPGLDHLERAAAEKNQREKFAESELGKS